MPEFSAWMLVTILGLALITPALWKLFAVAGIPGDYKNVKSGLRAVSLAIAIFLAYAHYGGKQLFDEKSGQANFMVDEKNGQMHFIKPASGEDSDTARFSPETGEKLRPGKKEDAKKIGPPSQNILQRAVEVVKRENQTPCDTVVLAPNTTTYSPTQNQSQWVLYVIPAGNGWSGVISESDKMAGGYWFQTEVKTLVQARKKDVWSISQETYVEGKWLPPIPNGKGIKVPKEYFFNTSNLKWRQDPEQEIQVLARWN